MNTGYTVHNFPFNGELLDLELDIEYDISKFTPASIYGGADRCGWPAEGGEVEIKTIAVTAATTADGQNAFGAAPLGIQAAFDSWYAQNGDLQYSIDEKCQLDARDNPSGPDPDTAWKER